MRNLVLIASIVVAGAAGCSPATTSPSSVRTSSATSATAQAISLTVVSPVAGASIKGNTVALQLDAAGIAIVKADGDTSGRTGHFHVFVDRDPVPQGEFIPKEPGIIHSAANPVLLTGLATGNHRIVVVLGDGAHHRLGAAQAETSVTVTGPSVHAAIPATVAVGQGVTLTVTASGVNLIKGAEDASNKDGSAGHLHVFVNKDPTPPGSPIPTGDPAIIHTAATSIQIPASLLKPGANTIWVVLGYADHTPFAPPVEDQVAFTVS